jgi:tetratricopeptide (TPR) repeat protein
LSNLGRLAEGVDDARRALAVARELGYPAGEALALERLGIAAFYSGDLDGSVRLARQAGQIPADIPGWIARNCSTFLAEVLMESGDLAEAGRVYAAGLAQARDVGDMRNLAAMLMRMAMLEMRSGRTGDATAHLREALQISARTGGWFELASGLAYCGYLCAATERWEEAVTVWAAATALLRYSASAAAPASMRHGKNSCVRSGRPSGPPGHGRPKTAAQR